MRTKFIFSVLGVLLCYGGMAKATTVDFNDHQTCIIENGDNYDRITLHDYASVNMIGGEVTGFTTFNSSYITLSGGLIHSGISTFNNTVIEMNGGSVLNLELGNSSIMYLSGGNIDGVVSIFENAVLHIYAKDFLYTPEEYGFGGLSGHWINDTEFSIDFRFLQTPFLTGSSVVMHIVPEPCSFGLIVFGFFIVRRAIKIPHK